MGKKKMLRVLMIGIAAAALVLILDISCPIRAVTGIPCPACGLTRAAAAFLNGDIGLAFYYHPLFLLSWAVFVLLGLYWGLSAKKKLTPKGELLLVLVFAAIALAFIAVYLVRLISGIIP